MLLKYFNYRSNLLLISNQNLIRYYSIESPSYIQGQETNDQREYFYYLDHQGQLFLDDMKIKNFTSCYKEQKFLQFFFKNLRENFTTNKYYNSFPYVSLCGSERNYLKCDDLPFVITKLDENLSMVQINQITSAHWMFHFDPNNLYHNVKTGRLYYLFENKEIISSNNNNKTKTNIPLNLTRLTHLDKLPCRLALVKSEISINLMKNVKSVGLNNDREPILKFDFKKESYDLNSSDKSKAHALLMRYSQYKDNLINEPNK